MGIVSDEFARARADKHVARPMRPKQPTYGPPIHLRPASHLWGIKLPGMFDKDRKELYFQLGKLSRPEIEAGLARFRRIAREVNFS